MSKEQLSFEQLAELLGALKGENAPEGRPYARRRCPPCDVSEARLQRVATKFCERQLPCFPDEFEGFDQKTASS